MRPYPGWAVIPCTLLNCRCVEGVDLCSATGLKRDVNASAAWSVRQGPAIVGREPEERLWATP